MRDFEVIAPRELEHLRKIASAALLFASTYNESACYVAGHDAKLVCDSIDKLNSAVDAYLFDEEPK
jgi:hypothetical protein